jgi:topoisomerase-4 subunit A
MESIEKAAKSGKIKIQSINDYTAEEVEVEIKLARGIYSSETIKALYAFTDCEVSISPNLTVIQDNKPVNISVSEVLKYNTKKLIRDLETELTIDRDRLREKLHAHLLEQIFIEERLYKKIEECTSYKLVFSTIEQALEPFRERLVRDISQEDIERLLEIRIRRISRYDINKKKKDIKEVEKKIRKVEKELKDMVRYSISYLDKLIKKYGPLHPRMTRLRTFTEVEARKVALSNLTVGYHKESGFLGHQVQTDSDQAFPCSEYDRILIIFKDGFYKVISVPDKVFIGHDIFWVGKYDEKIIFNVIYRNGEQNLSYMKRFKTPKFILDKEYRLFPEHKRSVVQFLSLGEEGRIRVYYRPSKRARSNYEDFELQDFLIKGASALGKRVSIRVVRRIGELAEKKTDKETEEEGPKPLPLFPDKK